MIQVRKIHETHLGGFDRYEVRTDGRVTLLTAGDGPRAEADVLEHIAAEVESLRRQGMLDEGIAVPVYCPACAEANPEDEPECAYCGEALPDDEGIDPDDIEDRAPSEWPE